MIITLYISVAAIIVALCLIMVLYGITFHQYQILIKEMFEELDRIGKEVAKLKPEKSRLVKNAKNRFNK